jgi:hypothetical protein
MPETMRFVGAIGVVLPGLSGARFRVAMGWNNGLERLKISFILIHITDACCSDHVNEALGDRRKRVVREGAKRLAAATSGFR